MACVAATIPTGRTRATSSRNHCRHVAASHALPIGCGQESTTSHTIGTWASCRRRTRSRAAASRSPPDRSRALPAQRVNRGADGLAELRPPNLPTAGLAASGDQNLHCPGQPGHHAGIAPPLRSQRYTARRFSGVSVNTSQRAP